MGLISISRYARDSDYDVMNPAKLQYTQVLIVEEGREEGEEGGVQISLR